MNITNHPEVLIVDDDLMAAESFSELIKEKYRINTISTSDPQLAIEYVKNYPIKVVVLDQVMPKKGTDLFLELKQVNSAIQALMLTGEAERAEVDKAYKLGYGDYLEKTEILSLPNRVLNLYVKYQTNVLKTLKSDYLLLHKQFNYKNIFFPIKYYLYDTQILNKEFVFEDKWKVITEINSDEVEIEEIYEYEDEIYISQSDEEKVTGSLNVQDKIFDSLKIGINSELNRKYNHYFIQKNKQIKKYKAKYSLSPGKNEKPALIKKVIEYTPVYIEYSILICKKCDICNCFLLVPFALYKRTPKYATRHISFYDNGSRKEVFTGIHQK